jgi:2-dehydro-3-deoxyphosphogluconate aldolase/(4S)-4-hydroxy-2-oxoglutarate aldolase
MTLHDSVQQLMEPGIIAIIRSGQAEALEPVAAALLDGGVTAMEVTMTTPGALDAIRRVVAGAGERLLMGAGTVLDSETCRAALLAGARFIVTPTVKPDVIAVCRRYGVPNICGAMTPTECLTAHEAGADLVKLFPADHLGPAYVRSLLAPLPMLRIVPTGGVNPGNAGEYVRAGAVALGAGSTLVSREILANADWAALRDRAAAFVASVAKAKSEML